MPCTLAASPLGLCKLETLPPRIARKPDREAEPSGDLPTAALRSELLTNSAELDGPSSRSQAASARPSAKCRVVQPLRF